jgi:hypothetical protein
LIISSNQKVIRLNISMNDSLFMHLLNSLNLFEIIQYRLPSVWRCIGRS